MLAYTQREALHGECDGNSRSDSVALPLSTVRGLGHAVITIHSASFFFRIRNVRNEHVYTASPQTFQHPDLQPCRSKTRSLVAKQQ